MSKVFLKRADCALLRHSKNTDAVEWLRSYIQDKETVTEEDIAELPEEKQSFFKQSAKRLLAELHDEWVADKALGFVDQGKDKDGWDRCSLCNTPNRYVCYITNKYSGTRLNVGSSCIHQYGIDYDGMGGAIRKASEVRRQIELNNKFPGISDIVEEWNRQLEMYPVLVPKRFQAPYVALGEKVEAAYKSFIQGKDEDESSKIIEEGLSTRHSLLDAIEKHIEQVEGNRLAPTRGIVTWIDSRLPFDARQKTKSMLMEDELITMKTLHRIEESNFVRSFVSDFNWLFRSLKVRIVDTVEDNGKAKYVWVHDNSDDIKLYVNFADVAKDYGDVIFGSTLFAKPSINKLLKASSIAGDSTISAVIQYVSGYLNDTMYEVEGHDQRFNEFVIKQTVLKSWGKLESYVVINLIEFLGIYLTTAMGLTTTTKTDFLLFIEDPKWKRLTSGEYHEAETMRRRML